MTDKISLDMAEAEFERFAECLDIYIDEKGMDDEDLSSFRKQKERIIRAVQSGALIFNDDGEPVFTPQHKRSKHKDPLTFRERSGESLSVMDSKKKGQDVAKTYAVMASLCSVHPKVFYSLVGSDIKVCEAIFAFLMD